jgi:hypothetical protein
MTNESSDDRFMDAIRSIGTDSFWAVLRALGIVSMVHESDPELAKAQLRFLISYVAYRPELASLAHALASQHATSDDPADKRTLALTLRATNRKAEAASLVSGSASSEFETEIGLVLERKAGSLEPFSESERELLRKAFFDRKR